MWGVGALGLLELGVGVVISGPALVVCGGVAAAIGVGTGICDHYRFEKRLLRACEIYKKVEDTYIYPSIISSDKDFILIDLPNGMSIKDIVIKQGCIESYCERKVLIKQTSNKKVLIKLLCPGDNEQDRWLNIFNKIDLVKDIGEYPILKHSEINSVGQKVIFKLPYGLTVKDFIGKKEELEGALKCKLDIVEENYNMVIQTINRRFKDIYKLDFRDNLLPNMQFIVGIKRDGERLVMDLGGNEFSTLVCGASGSGKSVFLNCLMVQCILKGIEIRAIDLKAVEFKIFKAYKNMSCYATNRKDAIQVLADTFDLMQQRYKELEDKNCKSYTDYNKKFNNSMSPVLIIIDEFSVLAGGEKSKSNFFLFELLSRCRAANILTIICTQTPRAKILDTSIRCNIKNTVCFSCETDADSEVALGQKGNYRAARELKAIGRGFLKSKGKLIEFQGYFLEDREIEKQIATKMCRPKEIVEKEKEEQPVNSDKVISINKKKSQNVDKLIKAIEDL